MSTGKRLAKRSIIGTRVCAPGLDGKYYSGVIQAVKTAEEESRYSVRFDAGASCEYREHELVGPGFRSVAGLTLQPGQKVFLTYNGREVRGIVKSHQQQLDELMVAIEPPGQEQKLEVRKRLEEIRLLESRKSARLQDQDTDFARLADMAGDRRRTVSGSIDVPVGTGSRKRRPSYSQEDLDFMDECTAALVLMSLSCSPHSPRLTGASPSPASPLSWRSATPSPPLSDADSTTAFWTTLVADEGIVMDDFTDDLPKRKKARGSAEPYVLHNDSDSDASKGSRMVFQCTWPGCLAITTTCSAIESHVRQLHLGPRQTADGDDFSDHEEEFYYTEVELGLHTSSPPTMSHRDMARPPHEDPEYQKQLKNGPINIPNGSLSWPSSSSSLNSPQKHLKLSPRSGTTLSVSAPNKLLPGSPTRKLRGDTKKCRKVYGMEHRELWCTQCKWKKACTRFGD